MSIGQEEAIVSVKVSSLPRRITRRIVSMMALYNGRTREEEGEKRKKEVKTRRDMIE